MEQHAAAVIRNRFYLEAVDLRVHRQVVLLYRDRIDVVRPQSWEPRVTASICCADRLIVEKSGNPGIVADTHDAETVGDLARGESISVHVAQAAGDAYAGGCLALEMRDIRCIPAEFVLQGAARLNIVPGVGAQPVSVTVAGGEAALVREQGIGGSSPARFIAHDVMRDACRIACAEWNRKRRGQRKPAVAAVGLVGNKVQRAEGEGQ